MLYVQFQPFQCNFCSWRWEQGPSTRGIRDRGLSFQWDHMEPYATTLFCLVHVWFKVRTSAVRMILMTSNRSGQEDHGSNGSFNLYESNVRYCSQKPPPLRSVGESNPSKDMKELQLLGCCQVLTRRFSEEVAGIFLVWYALLIWDCGISPNVCR